MMNQESLLQHSGMYARLRKIYEQRTLTMAATTFHFHIRSEPVLQPQLSHFHCRVGWSIIADQHLSTT